MLEVIKMVPPSPEQFDAVFHGMRHAFKSYDRSDSFFCKKSFVSHENGTLETYIKGEFILGTNDKNLAINLVKAGNPSHRKFLRQLPIILEIKAPLFWWKQMDRYQVGTTTNSESTMHTLTKRDFDRSDFSYEFGPEYNKEPLLRPLNNLGDHIDDDLMIGPLLDDIILQLDILRMHYNRMDVIIEHAKDYADMYNAGHWDEAPVTKNFPHGNTTEKEVEEYARESKRILFRAMNGILPQSYNQTRTVSMNYEVALQIIEQRTNHKLPEWKSLIDELLKLPYMREFAEAAGLLEVDNA